MKKEDFEIIYEDLIENEKGREILVKDIIGGEDEEKKIKERVIKEYDWNQMLIRNMMISKQKEEID